VKTNGELYDPAMTIQTQEEASKYFNYLVDYYLEQFGGERHEAERIIKINLGYYAGYYDNETRARVEKLYTCEHPYFGRIAERGAPDASAALLMGLMIGLGLNTSEVEK
jgi:hypothetical protein